MQVIPQYIADAFTDRLFGGNQVAVCLPPRPLPDGLMQRIAIENNFSETSFVSETADGYELRWFAPGGEVDLCGHATLGTAFILLTELAPEKTSVTFHTASGVLTVAREGDLFVMNFPRASYRHVPVTDEMEAAIGVRPREAYLGRDLMMVVDTEDTVRNLQPDSDMLASLPGLIQCVTAPGAECDCVSRVFCPKIAIPEDPVTGSTHCMIGPYWADRLNKKHIVAAQASKRGGTLLCNLVDDSRIEIGGRCVLYSRGEIYV